MNEYRTIIVYGLSDFDLYKIYRMKKTLKVTYEHIKKKFLEDYQEIKKEPIEDIDKILVHTILFNENSSKIINLKDQIQENHIEIFISFDRDLFQHPQLQATEYYSHFFINQALYHINQGNYRAAQLFLFNTSKNGIVEYIRFFYKMKRWETVKNLIIKSKEYSLVFPDINEITGTCLEKIGNEEMALMFYDLNKNNSDISRIKYERLAIKEPNQVYINDLINSVLSSSETVSPELIKECVLLYIANHQYQEAVELSLTDLKLLNFTIQNSMDNKEYVKSLRLALFNSAYPLKVVFNIAKKMFKYGAMKEATRLAKHLFNKYQNYYSFNSSYDNLSDNTDHIFCSFLYLHFLFRNYKYEKFVEVVTIFLNRLQDKYGKYNVLEIKNMLESTTTFADMTFEKIDNAISNDKISDEEEICFLYIMMLIYLMFFIIGDISFSRKLNEYLDIKYMKENDMPIIFHDIHIMYQASSNIILHSQIIDQHDSNILVIGDIHSISCCNIRVEIKQESYQMTALPIEGLSIKELSQNDFKSQKKIFEKIAKNVYQFAYVLLFIGTIDCEQSIPNDFKCSATSLNDCIRSYVDNYINFLSELQKRFPITEFIIHPAIARYPWSSIVTKCFNEKLQQELPSSMVFLNPFPSSNLFNPTLGVTNGVLDSQYPLRLQQAFKKEYSF